MKKRRVRLWEESNQQTPKGERPPTEPPPAKPDLDSIFAGLTAGLDEEPSEDEMHHIYVELKRRGLDEVADLIEAEPSPEDEDPKP